MTGVVFQVVANVGARVAAGDPILILESMKMEIPVEAPRAGVVQAVQVAEGQTVQEGDVVALLE
jgi:biotin carboxyl carrier protein